MKHRGNAGTASSSGWTCPTCERRFARAKQWHSCKPQSIDSHFRGKDPTLKKLFDLLIGKLQKNGPLRVDAVKTSINLISRHHFGGVNVRRDYLRVGFLAREEIKSPRVVHKQVVGPNRIGHSVVVRSASDIDAELIGWLSAAQALESGERPANTYQSSPRQRRRSPVRSSP